MRSFYHLESLEGIERLRLQRLTQVRGNTYNYYSECLLYIQGCMCLLIRQANPQYSKVPMQPT